jgi:uncharacterized protein (DUF1778 family)
MREKTEELKVRCTPKFKVGVEKLAEREKTNVSEFMRRSAREHEDNVYGALRLLKKLLPLGGSLDC